MTRALLVALLLLPQETDHRRLLPLRVGNKWTYESGGATVTARVTRREKFHGESVHILQWDLDSEKDEEFLAVDESGIKLFRRRTKKERLTVDLKYPSPLLTAAFPPRAGQKWDVKMRKDESLIVRTTETLAPEKITVPAGTFDAQPFRITETSDGKTLAQITTWYAPDVGIVQRAWLENGRTTVLKLKASDAKAPAEPKVAADPDKVRAEIAGQLARRAKQALERGDAEQAHLLAELHRGLFGDALDLADEARRRALEGAETPTTDLAPLARELHDKFVTLPPDDERGIQGMMLKLLHEHATAYREVNRYRRLAGLGPTAWSCDLSRACTLHARYLARNGYRSFKTVREYHSEDPKKPFYSKEGDAAARRSDISAIALSSSVKAWMDTFYHRIPILDPALETVGTGMWDGSVDLSTPSVLDVQSARRARRENDPAHVAYPAPDQKGIDPHFNIAGERPEPVPGEDAAKLGYPITLGFYTHPRIRKVEAKLLLGGAEIPCHVSTPEKPTNPEAGPYATICLMPKAHLKPKSAYTVRIRAEVNGEAFEKEWSFTTK